MTEPETYQRDASNSDDEPDRGPESELPSRTRPDDPGSGSDADVDISSESDGFGLTTMELYPDGRGGVDRVHVEQDDPEDDHSEPDDGSRRDIDRAAYRASDGDGLELTSMELNPVRYPHQLDEQDRSDAEHDESD